MPNVNVTIDGVAGTVPPRSTVMEAAKLLGVDIPTLCDHPELRPIGACRICLVEVEKQRTLQPACTFPVSEGMVVHTESPAVVDSRRFVLQLLFSERNHYCMFCQMSGSCELQSLAYRYGLEHWIYDRPYPKLPVDASRVYFVMDHNRCILCRRCVRACDELVGNGTLGLKHRGANTMIIADMDVPFGESSCVSCGTCLQVCPTGALMDRASAYMGATKDVTRVPSTCTACSVGCGTDLILRENRVIRVEGHWDAQPNKGLLCEAGRFALLHEKRQRVRKPLVRNQKDWNDVSWEDALQQAATGLKAAGQRTCSIVSGLASSETAQALAQLPGDKMLLDGASLPTQESLAALDEADLYLVPKLDLSKRYPVAGFAVKRGVRQRGAHLIQIGSPKNDMDPWTMRNCPTDQIAKAIQIAQGAQLPVIIYDAAGADIAAQLAQALPKAKLVAFVAGANTRGLVANGITQPFAANGAKAYLVVAAETAHVPSSLLEALQQADFVVVQSSFREPWDQVADVILPSPIAYEKAGTFVSTEGRINQVSVAVQTRLLPEEQVIQRLAALL
jgi:formate dehydrogenase major subunit